MNEITWQTKHAKIITICYGLLSKYIRSSKIITKLIFGMNPYPKYRSKHWDLITLVLKKALDKYVIDYQKILELGTSDLAILSIYIAKKKHVDITAVDICPEFVENAKVNASKNNVKINILQSDLFSNVNGCFDVVFFNPPYLPTESGPKYEVDKCNNALEVPLFNSVWDGGEDGCDVIRRFLQNSPEMLLPDGKIILGVNTFFVHDLKIKEIIRENNLKLISEVTSIFSSVKAYVIEQ